MGTVGREIVGDARESIIEDLNRSIAAELNDAYRYLLLSKLAEGIHAADVAEFFVGTAQDEWGHMAQMIERVLELGGRPMAGPHEARQLSYTGYMEPPKDGTEVRKMLEDSLAGERDAIRFYKQLYDRTRDVDPITAEMAREQLADEVHDEDELERLLAAGTW